MDRQPNDEEIEEARGNLTKRENEVLDEFLASSEQPVDPNTHNKIFSFFLEGKPTYAISNLVKGVTWGQIVHARIMGRWDEKVYQHTQDLLSSTVSRVQRVTVDSVNVISGWIEAANTVYQDKLKQFSESKDPEVLGVLGMGGIKQYAQAVDVLKSLTGQAGKQSGVTPAVRAQPVLDEAPAKKRVRKPLLEQARPVSPDEAADTMKQLLEAKK